MLKFDRKNGGVHAVHAGITALDEVGVLLGLAVVGYTRTFSAKSARFVTMAPAFRRHRGSCRKTEAGTIAKRPHLFSFVFSPVRLCAVFQNKQAVSMSNLHDARHVAGQPYKWTGMMPLVRDVFSLQSSLGRCNRYGQCP